MLHPNSSTDWTDFFFPTKEEEEEDLNDREVDEEDEEGKTGKFLYKPLASRKQLYLQVALCSFLKLKPSDELVT